MASLLQLLVVQLLMLVSGASATIGCTSITGNMTPVGNFMFKTLDYNSQKYLYCGSSQFCKWLSHAAVFEVREKSGYFTACRGNKCLSTSGAVVEYTGTCSNIVWKCGGNCYDFFSGGNAWIQIIGSNSGSWICDKNSNGFYGDAMMGSPWIHGCNRPVTISAIRA